MLKNISEAYQYLFYKFYSWDERAWGKSKVSPQTAWHSISLICFLWFLNIICGLQLVTKIFDNFFSLPKPLVLLIMFFFLIPNYYFFLKKDKYIKIIKKFEKESKVSKFIGNILSLFFILFSVGLLIFLCRLYFLSKVV